MNVHDGGASVIVTGASRGIGAATAAWLGVAGSSVTLVARDPRALQLSADEVHARGGRALCLTTDLTRPGAVNDIVTRAIEQWGRIDAVINNAATLGPIARIADADPDALAAALHLNLIAPFSLVGASLKELRRSKGRVLNLSSTAAHTPIAGLAAYCVAKSALDRLTRVLAEEEPDITAVSVQPGSVDTGMHVALRTATALGTERHRMYIDLQKEGRLLQPEMPGRVLAWIALKAPPAWSGTEIECANPVVAKQAEQAFAHLSD